MNPTHRFRSLVSVVGAFSLLCSSGFLFTQEPARSNPRSILALDASDMLCYMQTADGRVINLSKLCGSRNRNYPVLSTIDQAFLARYQEYLRTRLGGLPQTQTALAQAQQNPQAIIQRAQATCAIIQSGESAPAMSSLAQIDAKVVKDLALNYYCPNLDD